MNKHREHCGRPAHVNKPPTHGTGPLEKTVMEPDSPVAKPPRNSGGVQNKLGEYD